MNENSNSTTVLSLDLYSGSLAAVIDRIKNNISQKKHAYVCAANVHMSVLAKEDESFRRVVNNAELVVPDGRPLFWMLRFLGDRNSSQIRGGDLFNALCELANNSDIRLGFYGGANEDVLTKLLSNLTRLYPKANLVFFYSPPFGEIDQAELGVVCENIRESAVDVLFVGIGCPKQERWMAENSPKIKCTMIGVGAVFDFVAGTKNQAPKVLQTIGLEWLFRLCSEPRRLWRRNLVGNTKFIFYILRWLVVRN